MSAILVVSRNLPPLTGGMERLSRQVVELLARHHHCRVIGPPGCAAHLPASVEVDECRSHKPGRFLAAASWLAAHAREPRPRLVIATSGVTAPVARLAARRSRCPCLIFVHGLDIVAPQWVYQRLFWPAARSADHIVANSANTRTLAVMRGADPEAVTIINPGVEWPQALVDGAAFRARFELGQAPLLLAVGRFAARKGLPEFIEHVLPRILSARPETRFVIIGDEASDAIRREDSVKARIEAAVVRAGVAHAVRHLGTIEGALLEQAYAAADCHVFPLVPVDGDVEGFGMVAAEAASHGLWTVAFAEGGVADAVQHDVTGTLVARGDFEAFANAVGLVLERQNDVQRRGRCREAARRHDWSRFDSELLETLDKLGIE